MTAFFDTSVLVPVFYGDHVHHQASLELFIQQDKSSGCCGASVGRASAIHRHLKR
jgi:predicted nucleic acid-binding protein